MDAVTAGSHASGAHPGARGLSRSRATPTIPPIVPFQLDMDDCVAGRDVLRRTALFNAAKGRPGSWAQCALQQSVVVAAAVALAKGPNTTPPAVIPKDWFGDLPV